jgi:hypothetical protein
MDKAEELPLDIVPLEAARPPLPAN